MPDKGYTGLQMADFFTMTLLYIDPGTGSMLFSILIGVASMLYFLSKAAVLRLKVFFSGRKGGVVQDASYKPYVIYNEGLQYWNVFKPICDAFERRHIPLAFLTSAEDDPVFSQGYTYVKPEFIGAGNVAFARLNMLSAGIVLMTTPGLHVYQLKRSKNVRHYAHIVHASSDATMYRLFGLDFFDSVLLSGDYQGKDIRALEQQRGIPQKELVTVGCTYLDVLASRISAIPAATGAEHVFTVLVSPSWGASGLLSRYGEKLLDPLAATGWKIIIRPHPQSRKSEGAMLERLEQRYRGRAGITWDYERENIGAMRQADIMISDFSGIIFDFSFLCDKPVLYVDEAMNLLPYDAYDLAAKPWQFETVKKMGIELQESQFPDIRRVIEGASDSPELAAARKAAKAQAWMHQGEAGERTADFMTETLARLDAAAQAATGKTA